MNEISDKRYQEALAQSEEMRKLLEEHRQNRKELEDAVPKEQLSLKRQKELIEPLKKDMQNLISLRLNKRHYAVATRRV